MLESRVLMSASMIKDINTVLADANPTNFVVSNGELYFTAQSNYPGIQWETNGTTTGTGQINSLVPGDPKAAMLDLTDVNGTLYFFSQGPSDGTGEGLYKSNGTVAGTTEVENFVGGGDDLTNADGTVFFLSGDVLWKTDGTAAGTVSIASFVGERGASPSNLFAVNNTLYFTVGPELWKSDGTAAGTTGFYGQAGTIYSMAEFNGELYFSSMAGLYSSDGIAAGTQPVPNAPVEVGGIFADGGTLYFAAGYGPANSASLWKTDGTGAGTVEVSSAPNEGVGPFTQVNGELYFYGTDATHGTELWRSDGTAAGTQIVADINPGPASSTTPNDPNTTPPIDLIGFNGQVYFDANDGVHGIELWTSDGTADGTSQLLQINTDTLGSDPGTSGFPSSVTIGNITYFEANDGIHGDELWQTDGTAGGSSLVADINPGSGGSNLGGLFDFDGKLLFDAYNGTTLNLYEISQPGAAPTILGSGFGVTDYTLFDGEVYFFASDASGFSLMATDGTAAGTRQIMNVSPTYGGLSMVNLNGTLYFTTLDSGNHMSLWKTNGTSAGTSEVISFAGTQADDPDFTVLGGSLYFETDDGTHGPALWKTTGTASGTSMVWASGSATAVPTDLYVYNGNLYFTLNNPDSYPNQGAGVYQTNGTAAGTVLLADYTNVNDFTAALGKLFFVGAAPGTYVTFCVTDGTAAGTTEINPSLTANNSTPIMPVNGTVFLDALDSSAGENLLWQTNGTTAQLADPNEPSSGWTVNNLIGQVGNTLLFSATDAVHGSELWGLPVAPLSTTANFQNTDTSTGGSWEGKYGSDGYDVIGGGESLPSYVTLSTDAADYYQWAAPGYGDSRAPEIGAGSTTSQAACDFSGTSFSINLAFNDGQSHQVALYLVDYDYRQRSETVQVSNSVTGQVLDTRTISNFENGQYLVYTLSGNVTISFINAPGSLNSVLSGVFFDPIARTTAAFAGVDTSTQGHWTGVYGSQGYNVIDGSSSLPSSVHYSINGEQYYEWATSTTDSRDLQTSAGSSNLVAACAYSDNPSFSINLDFLDNQAHQVSFYLLDYDGRNRAETIQITNAVTGAVLSTQTFSNFTKGEYVRWDLSGDVNITFSNAGGLNEVVSGFFIDPVPSAASATFVKTDSTTMGSYSGVYGKDGYDVINASESLPSYATLSIPSSVANYTWSPDTTQVNALQDSPGSSARIAACDYSNNAGFGFNLDLTDGQTHQVALYLLDYDYQHRAETIQIYDANTGKLLDSENVSNFTSGKYLVWDLSGDVNITITNAGGLNEVLSGVFFG